MQCCIDMARYLKVWYVSDIWISYESVLAAFHFFKTPAEGEVHIDSCSQPLVLDVQRRALPVKAQIHVQTFVTRFDSPVPI